MWNEGGMGGGGMTGWIGQGYKDGAAFANPTASLSALSGSVLRRPTPFLFARGAALGVAGEAGPEAVMPLQRGPNGKLGVQMYGGGAGAQISVSITTNVETGATEENTQGQQDANIKQFAERMRGMVVEGIQRSMLPGGDLYAAGVRN